MQIHQLDDLSVFTVRVVEKITNMMDLGVFSLNNYM